MSKKQGIDVVGPLFLDDFNPDCDDFYDNVVKRFDLPLEEVDGNLLAEDWNAKFKFLELPSSDIIAEFSSSLNRLCGDDSGPLSTPSECELKPKPKDSSQGSGETTSARNIFFGGIKDSGLFQTTSSSVSVLDSGGSWSGDNSLHLGFGFFIPVKRARSKRMRPHTLNPRLTSIPFIHFAEKEKGKKKNFSIISGRRYNNESTLLSNGIRKCSHCEVTKTPQWREGPMGPKTLCNACGVRYRSGRLYPEYRPAASPTFVASQHSNSHKKVIEMRKKVTCDGVVEDDSLRPPIRMLGNYPDGCLSV